MLTSFGVMPAPSYKQRSGVGSVGLPQTRSLTLAAHARHDVDRRMFQIARPFRRCDHQRNAAVALLAAVEQAEWIDDPARILMVFDGNRLAHHRLLIEDGVAALGNGEMGEVERRRAVARHVSGGDGTEGSGGVMDAERRGPLRIALDVVGPLGARGASLAVAVARLENQDVLADPRVHEHGAGKHRAAVPAAAAVAIELKVAFLEAQRTDQFADHLTFRLAVVKRNHAIDILDLQPGVGDRLEARLSGERQGRDSGFARERGPAKPDNRRLIFDRLLRHVLTSF